MFKLAKKRKGGYHDVVVMPVLETMNTFDTLIECFY